MRSPGLVHQCILYEYFCSRLFERENDKHCQKAAGDDVIVNIFCFWPILLLIPDCDDGDDNDYDDDVDYVA